MPECYNVTCYIVTIVLLELFSLFDDLYLQPVITVTGKISISVIIKQGRPGDIDPSDFSFYFDKDMDFEKQTINKEQMEELQKSIQKSLKGLKMKNISQLKTAHKH